MQEYRSRIVAIYIVPIAVLIMKKCCHMGRFLRYEEILRVCKILTTLGIDKFKITGGEPLVRKGCSDFIRELKKTDGVNKVTLTTNGILLSKDLVKLAEAGVDGINISLDFMDQEKYKRSQDSMDTNRSYQ